MCKKKLIRITTVPMALKFLLPGQMNFMQQNGFDVVMISADGKERNDVIDNENCRHIIVPMTRRITPLKDLQCLYLLIKIFKEEKPDIVHSHTPKAGLLGMIAAKICGIKIRIHTVAGLPLMVEKGAKFQLLKWIEKLTYWCATKVWPNSFSLLKYIEQNKFTTPKKLKVISKGSSNGINLNRFNSLNFDDKIITDIKKSIEYDDKNIYLLSIGRLVKDKGIIELVETFCSLQNEFTLIKLILVGTLEQELDPIPQHIIDQISLNNNIIHIEWSNYVEYYLSLANLFIFPSHREGLPNVLLQAGAIGTPIICSTIAGNIDIVEDYKTGLLFTVNDTESIKNKITFALQNKILMKDMAICLKQNVHQFYEREIIWKSILTEYNELLKK